MNYIISEILEMKIKLIVILYEPNYFKYVFLSDKFQVQLHRITATSACSVTNI